MAPYSQVAPLTNQQQAGMALTSNLSQPVQNYLGGTMDTSKWLGSGALMDPKANPYLTGMYNAAAAPMIQNYQTSVAPNLLQQAAQSGTLGSSGTAQGFDAAQSSLAQGLGDLASNMYGQAYNTGLQGTLQAQAQAPSLASAQYTPADKLLGAGGMGQQQTQNILDTAVRNLTGQANWPFQALGNLGQALGPAGGTQSTVVTPWMGK
jgi:hypothetical protein